jgi:hypothetical protein
MKSEYLSETTCFDQKYKFGEWHTNRIRTLAQPWAPDRIPTEAVALLAFQ